MLRADPSACVCCGVFTATLSVLSRMQVIRSACTRSPAVSRARAASILAAADPVTPAGALLNPLQHQCRVLADHSMRSTSDSETPASQAQEKSRPSVTTHSSNQGSAVAPSVEPRLVLSAKDAPSMAVDRSLPGYTLPLPRPIGTRGKPAVQPTQSSIPTQSAKYWARHPQVPLADLPSRDASESSNSHPSSDPASSATQTSTSRGSASMREHRRAGSVYSSAGSVSEGSVLDQIAQFEQALETQSVASVSLEHAFQRRGSVMDEPGNDADDEDGAEYDDRHEDAVQSHMEPPELRSTAAHHAEPRFTSQHSSRSAIPAAEQDLSGRSATLSQLRATLHKRFQDMDMSAISSIAGGATGGGITSSESESSPESNHRADSTSRLPRAVRHQHSHDEQDTSTRSRLPPRAPRSTSRSGSGSGSGSGPGSGQKSTSGSSSYHSADRTDDNPSRSSQRSNSHVSWREDTPDEVNRQSSQNMSAATGLISPRSDVTEAFRARAHFERLQEQEPNTHSDRSPGTGEYQLPDDSYAEAWNRQRTAQPRSPETGIDAEARAVLDTIRQRRSVDCDRMEAASLPDDEDTEQSAFQAEPVSFVAAPNQHHGDRRTTSESESDGETELDVEVTVRRPHAQAASQRLPRDSSGKGMAEVTPAALQPPQLNNSATDTRQRSNFQPAAMHTGDADSASSPSIQQYRRSAQRALRLAEAEAATAGHEADDRPSRSRASPAESVQQRSDRALARRPPLPNLASQLHNSDAVAPGLGHRSPAQRRTPFYIPSPTSTVTLGRLAGDGPPGDHRQQAKSPEPASMYRHPADETTHLRPYQEHHQSSHTARGRDNTSTADAAPRGRELPSPVPRPQLPRSASRSASPHPSGRGTGNSDKSEEVVALREETKLLRKALERERAKNTVRTTQHMSNRRNANGQASASALTNVLFVEAHVLCCWCWLLYSGPGAEGRMCASG